MPAPRRSLHREASSSSASTGVGLEGTTSRLPKQSPNSSPLPQQAKNGQGQGGVAIDLGAYGIRICIAGGQGAPPILAHCPNAVVRSSQKRYSGGSTGPLAGPQIPLKCTNYGSLTVRQPMDRGMIVDWPTQKMILDLALVDALGKEKAAATGKVDQKRLLEGRSVIITEAYFNLPDLQAALDLLLLEEYGAAKVWRCAPAHLIPYQPSLFPQDQSAPSLKKRLRPECMCIIDLGHSATHVVPVLGDSVIWSAARRHVISQRLLTNLLKETLSFRQWDMMDEGWLVGHIKERCCFVASSAGRRGECLKGGEASKWSYAAMLEMCSKVPRQKNRLALEYVLPDYSLSSSKGKLGHIRGRKDARLGSADADMPDRDSAQAADQSERGEEQGEGDEDEDEDASDDDFREGSPAVSAQPKKKKAKKAASSAAVDEDESDMEQVLLLERERFQVPEVMFDPGIIGLDDAPLHQVVNASIGACEKDLQGPLWANIVLVGGGAKMQGIKERLYNELRPLAPLDAPVHIWQSEDPSLSAILGAHSLLANSHRLLSKRSISAEDYSVQGSRERFGSWSSVSPPSS